VIQKLFEQGDYLYFIYRGKCKILFPVAELHRIFVESVLIDAEAQKYVVMGHLGTGDLFGEQSSLNDLPNPYSIVAATNKVEYYRIHRTNFNAFFSGALGE